jgi:hypothetical protein
VIRPELTPESLAVILGLPPRIESQHDQSVRPNHSLAPMATELTVLDILDRN